eukprot:c19096_g1_i2.p1 GENE.c19096_g1_i2~~c19096_g1_i2.p1  ORF type:complete len:313 (+),score=97.10 c19096_g1_i2:32-970(+)
MGNNNDTIPSTRELFQAPTSTFLTHIFLALSLWLVTGLFSAYYVYELKKSQHKSAIRHYYCLIVMFAFFNASLGCLGMIDMRNHYVYDILRSIYEAFALSAFLQIMIRLSGGEKNLITNAAEHSPRNWFRSPPCGFLFLCRKAERFTPQTLRYAELVVKQFIICIVSIAIISFLLFNQGLMNARQISFSHAFPYIHAVEVVSMLFAVHGLFIVYFAVHDPLEHFHVGRKFVAVKLLIFLGVVHNALLTICVHYGILNGVKLNLDVEAAVVHWENFLLVVESFCVALLLFYAYPVSELELVAAEKLEDGDPEL